jgi:hypothetical protein
MNAHTWHWAASPRNNDSPKSPNRYFSLPLKVGGLHITCAETAGSLQRCDGGPLRRILRLVLVDQSNGALLDLRRKSWSCSHGINLSHSRVSGKPGAIQLSTASLIDANFGSLSAITVLLRECSAIRFCSLPLNITPESGTKY